MVDFLKVLANARAAGRLPGEASEASAPSAPPKPSAPSAPLPIASSATLLEQLEASLAARTVERTVALEEQQIAVDEEVEAAADALSAAPRWPAGVPPSGVPRAAQITVAEEDVAPVAAVRPPMPEEIRRVLDPDHEPFSCIMGIAGTGKTYLSRAWEASDPARYALVATTGIAAVNLGGATINSTLGFFNTESLQEAYLAGYLPTKLARLMRGGVRRLICDEMSMMDAHQVTILVSAIDEINGRCRNGKGGGGLTSSDQFGLTLVGDFCQLPPVKAPFAFESPQWERFAAHTLSLTEIRRQSDQDFIQALHAVRRAQITDDVIDILRPAMVYPPSLDYHFDGTTLVAKNLEVDRVNNLRYLELKGTEASFYAQRVGQQTPEWRKQIPDELRLKEGALVMLLANEATEYLDGIPVEYAYVNGDLGTVVSLDKGQCRVKLHRHRGTDREEEAVLVTDVTREWWEPGTPERTKRKWWDGPLTERPKELLGDVTYLPVRLAYASTCHKAQGLTFDNVQVTLKDPFWGNPAMAYVALSRVRTLAGLRLVATPEWLRARAKVHPLVKAWV